MNFDVLIVTNGPGELSSWVKPLVTEINNTLPEARILIFLVPCPYASGEEQKTAESFQGVHTVFSEKDTSLYLLSGKLPQNFNFQDKGVIIHLGGDQFFTVLMTWKTKFLSLAYTEKHIFWPSVIDKFLLPDQNLYASARLRGIDASKITVVGNLMVDSVVSQMSPQEIRDRLGLSTDKAVVSLLPGSKPFKVKYSTPFMLKIADYIAKKYPDVQFILSQSPYTPLFQIVGSVTDPDCISALDGVSARFGRDKNGNVLVTEQGTIINIVPPEFQYEAYQISDVAITLPGTNTAELAVLGIPMVVIFPTDKPEKIPAEGLIGMISDIPLIGKYIKKMLIKHTLKRIKFTSLPNQRLGRLVTPELTGSVHPVEVSDSVVEILENPLIRREISLNLKKSMGSVGATKNIINIIVDSLLKRYPDIEILENINNFSDWTKRESDSE